MGDIFRQNYGGLPLQYEKELSDDVFDEGYYEDTNEFIPRIEGTEIVFGVAFLSSNYLPIMTSRVNKGKRKYYLFDFIKVWQTDDETNCNYSEDKCSY